MTKVWQRCGSSSDVDTAATALKRPRRCLSRAVTEAEVNGSLPAHLPLRSLTARLGSVGKEAGGGGSRLISHKAINGRLPRENLAKTEVLATLQERVPLGCRLEGGFVLLLAKYLLWLALAQ